MNPYAAVEDLLKFYAAADAPGPVKTPGQHDGEAVNLDRPRAYDETVRRLRPLARRRLRTSRPFFVLMRTRKPCVRLRRRRLGWNVRFMMSDPLRSTATCGET